MLLTGHGMFQLLVAACTSVHICVFTAAWPKHCSRKKAVPWAATLCVFLTSNLPKEPNPTPTAFGVAIPQIIGNPVKMDDLGIPPFQETTTSTKVLGAFFG